MEMMKAIRRTFIGYGLLTFFRSCALLPFPMVRKLGRALGYLEWRLNNSFTKISRANLKLCQSGLNIKEKNLEALVKASVQSDLQILTESAYIWHHSWDKLKKTIYYVDGLQLFKDKLKCKRGLLVLVPHISTWEILNGFVSQITPSHALYRPSKYPPLDAFMKAAREKNNITLHPITYSGIKNIMKCLMQGETAFILPDQEPKNDAGIFANKFNIQTLTATLPLRLIQKTQCNVLCMFVQRNENKNCYIIHIKEVDNNMFNTDLFTAVQAMNNTIEKAIKTDPSQYIWGYKRFKYSPSGKRDIYKYNNKK